jgi:SAM-dependent methyltransferase
MYPDVVDLREFYESELGRLTRRLVQEGCRRLWPSVQGEIVIGCGYATPYLRPFMQEADRVMALMPAQQGVTWWPREGPNATALIEETQLPLPDQSVDRVILAHGLENTDHIGDLLQECWRVLKPQGRLLVIVPGRSGWWARSAQSPFGYGFSFSFPHLRRVLVHNRFQIERHDRAVFVPPWAIPVFGKSIDWMERQGRRFIPAFAGVLLVEVSKQVYARPIREKVRMARPVIVPMPDLVSPTPTRWGRS